MINSDLEGKNKDVCCQTNLWGGTETHCTHPEQNKIYEKIKTRKL